MEKRRKNTSVPDFDAEAGYLATDSDDAKKVRSLSAGTIFLSFMGLLTLIYVLSIVIIGRNKDIDFKSIYSRDRVDSVDLSRVKPFNIAPEPVVQTSNSLATEKMIEDTNTAKTIEEGNLLGRGRSGQVVPESQDVLQHRVTDTLEQIRHLKQNGVVIETDSTAKALVKNVQNDLRKLIPLKYGIGPYFLEMKLTFPPTMPDYHEEGEDGIIIIQLGPIELVPYSIYYFMELASDWKGGAFHRVAGHVLQALVRNPVEGLAFQEYHPDFPHRIMTLGYAGRPGGPEFYISTQDNVENHGPGSQGSATEADSCFGKIFIGERVVDRIKRQPGAAPPSGFVDKTANFIRIPHVRIMTTEEVNHLET